MVRSILALTFGFVFWGQCLAQQSLVGTYKLVLSDRRLDGIPVAPVGKSHGYLVITPKVYINFFTDDDRKRGTSVEAKAALLDSLAAWAGPYRVEGNKITISVDTAWTEVWKGTEQPRTFELKGKRLTILTAPQPSATQPGKTFTSRAEYEKID
jgi:lipocalin-like protein